MKTSCVSHLELTGMVGGCDLPFTSTTRGTPMAPQGDFKIICHQQDTVNDYSPEDLEDEVKFGAIFLE